MSSSYLATTPSYSNTSTTLSTSSHSSYSSHATRLEKAKQLALQAVNQDSLQNYEKSAKFYREAIAEFRCLITKNRQLEKHPAIKSGVKEKIQICSERLKILDRYLLEQKDLSPLFKDVVDSELNNNTTDHSSYPVSKSVTLEKAENDYEVITPVAPTTTTKQMMITQSNSAAEECFVSMKDLRGSSISITGSTHSLYPRCEIKRASSIMSGASDFGIGEEIYENPSKLADITPPLADLKNELRLSLSSLSSDEGITTTIKRKKKPSSPIADADAIIVLDEYDDETRLLETSFEEEKDDEITYVRADRISTNTRFNKTYGDASSDSGISEERTVISSSSDSGSNISRNKSPISDCVDVGAGSLGGKDSSFSGSTYELYTKEDILLAETQQPTRERYDYVPPRAFARNKKEKESDGCFYLMACLDAFGVL
ncbi:unnamed protein product [Lepeophtheirus salmonis]|uniref:(salmon louse) hypothetical protein n=1 Tax=Lepeophtheirus salmonis TaxID=72036 RepID=A0A7R8H4Y8_LEPSM|nr:unnamed protein product [Lepeophtheirus salmonis]CAF2868907.1 unnamed protein product [Lepeophtheirus salmonis]